jgi:hypothetical protein
MALAHNWAGRVLQEFFRQGDAERVLGLYPVLPVMDRNNPMPKSVYQSAFIKQICLPLYATLNAVPGLDFSVQVRALEHNARQWVGDTSETHRSRLKETRSFSLQKRSGRKGEFKASKSKEDADRASVEHEIVTDDEGANSPAAVMRSKSLEDYSPRAASDVQHRLNLSPRAFLSEADGASSRRAAIREAVLRARASKAAGTPPNVSPTVTMPSPTRSAAPLPPTPTRRVEIISSPKSAFKSARKSAIREEDETKHVASDRKRKDPSKGRSSGRKPPPS